MKKLHLTFGLIALAAIVAGLIHGGIAWIIAEVTWDPMMTSFPTWGAFVLPFLFYGAVALAVVLVWFCTWLIVRGIRKKQIAKQPENMI